MSQAVAGGGGYSGKSIVRASEINASLWCFQICVRCCAINCGIDFPFGGPHFSIV